MFVHRTYFAKRGRQNRADVIPVNQNKNYHLKKYANSFLKRNFRSNGIHQREKSVQSNLSFLTNTTL